MWTTQRSSSLAWTTGSCWWQTSLAPAPHTPCQVRCPAAQAQLEQQACCSFSFESKLTDCPASNILADGVILCHAACLSAVVPAPGAGDDGFAFSPPVPPTANGSMAPGAARKQLYGPVLSQLRGLMIARMAKPEVSGAVRLPPAVASALVPPLALSSARSSGPPPALSPQRNTLTGDVDSARLTGLY